MKLYDLCIFKKDFDIYKQGLYAIIIDIDHGDDYHVEIWDFEKNEGADINYINKLNLRLATDEEQKVFQDKFKQYCNKYGD